jgi:hypothetical protein
MMPAPAEIRAKRGHAEPRCGRASPAACSAHARTKRTTACGWSRWPASPECPWVGGHVSRDDWFRVAWNVYSGTRQILRLRDLLADVRALVSHCRAWHGTIGPLHRQKVICDPGRSSPGSNGAFCNEDQKSGSKACSRLSWDRTVQTLKDGAISVRSQSPVMASATDEVGYPVKIQSLGG